MLAGTATSAWKRFEAAAYIRAICKLMASAGRLATSSFLLENGRTRTSIGKMSPKAAGCLARNLRPEAPWN